MGALNNIPKNNGGSKQYTREINGQKSTLWLISLILLISVILLIPVILAKFRALNNIPDKSISVVILASPNSATPGNSRTTRYGRSGVL